MVRNIIFLMFLLVSTIAMADDASLQAIYGSRLYSANIDVRYAFMRAVGKKWEDSTYSQRRDFLTSYQERISKENKEARLLEEKKTQEEKQLEQEIKDKEKAKQTLERNSDRKELKNIKEEKKLKRAADKKVKAMQREIDQLKNKDRKAKD